LRQIRCATCSSVARLIRSAIFGSSSSGMTDSIVGGRPVTTASRCDSTPAISFSIASSNSLTPSVSSLSVTSFMSMPASASAWSSACASSALTSAEFSLTSPWSANASSVGIGIVLTVSGAISSSTYIVSG
jgi:hypothetical protein